MVRRLAPPTPNPFGAETSLRFDVLEVGRRRLSIYDARGRRVRRLADETFVAGSHTLRWDGTDTSGRSVPAGVYYAVLEGGGRRESLPIQRLP
jgi:flagellar hook assembly protein FlgD